MDETSGIIVDGTDESWTTMETSGMIRMRVWVKRRDKESGKTTLETKVHGKLISGSAIIRTRGLVVIGSKRAANQVKIVIPDNLTHLMSCRLQ